MSYFHSLNMIIILYFNLFTERRNRWTSVQRNENCNVFLCYERLIVFFFEDKELRQLPQCFIPLFYILRYHLRHSDGDPLFSQSNVKLQQTILVAGRGSEHITLERRPATVDNLAEGKTGGSRSCSFGFPLTDRESTGELALLYYNLPSACSFSCYHELSRSNVYYLNCVQLSFHRPISTTHYLYYYYYLYCYYYYLLPVPF